MKKKDIPIIIFNAQIEKKERKKILVYLVFADKFQNSKVSYITKQFGTIHFFFVIFIWKSKTMQCNVLLWARLSFYCYQGGKIVDPVNYRATKSAFRTWIYVRVITLSVI